jgi:hypothetical protein
MRFCVKCGSEIPEGAEFCPNCGAPIEKAGSITAPLPSKTARNQASVSILERMIRAAKLDSTLYEEVESDEAATIQALTVVVIASVCSAIGNAVGTAMMGMNTLNIVTSLVGGVILALVGWLIWSFITYFVGTKVFGGTASYGELLRTTGFSDSPGVLLIFSFIPILGGLISFIVGVWGLVAMVVAVRQALDFSTGKAILTCIVGFIVYIVLIAIPFLLIGL